MSRGKQAEIFATGFLVAGLAASAATAKLWTDGAELGGWKMTTMGIVAIAMVISGAIGLWRVRRDEEKAEAKRLDSEFLALLIQKGSRPSVFTGMCTRRSHRLQSVTQRASG